MTCYPNRLLFPSDELGIIFNIPPPSSGGISEATVATASLEGTRSEPHFIVQEHKLGISVHSVHPLINEARGAFFSARKDYLRARDVVFGGTSAIICTPDINVCESADAELSLATATSRLMSVTRALLLVNADHGSAWNARKKVIQHGKCGSVLEEIKVKIYKRYPSGLVLLVQDGIRHCGGLYRICESLRPTCSMPNHENPF